MIRCSIPCICLTFTDTLCNYQINTLQRLISFFVLCKYNAGDFFTNDKFFFFRSDRTHDKNDRV